MPLHPDPITSAGVDRLVRGRHLDDMVVRRRRRGRRLILLVLSLRGLLRLRLIGLLLVVRRNYRAVRQTGVVWLPWSTRRRTALTGIIRAPLPSPLRGVVRVGGIWIRGVRRPGWRRTAYAL